MKSESYQNTGKTHYREVIWQPVLRIQKHCSSVHRIFHENTREINDTHWLFALLVFEVKIYCMQAGEM